MLITFAVPHLNNPSVYGDWTSGGHTIGCSHNSGNSGWGCHNNGYYGKRDIGKCIHWSIILMVFLSRYVVVVGFPYTTKEFFCIKAMQTFSCSFNVVTASGVLYEMNHPATNPSSPTSPLSSPPPPLHLSIHHLLIPNPSMDSSTHWSDNILKQSRPLYVNRGTDNL